MGDGGQTPRCGDRRSEKREGIAADSKLRLMQRMEAKDGRLIDIASYKISTLNKHVLPFNVRLSSDTDFPSCNQLHFTSDAWHID